MISATGADQDVTLRSQRLHRGNVTKRALTLFKHWRGLATRYDKHVTVYRGALVLAAALLRIEDLSGVAAGVLRRSQRCSSRRC